MGAVWGFCWPYLFRKNSVHKNFKAFSLTARSQNQAVPLTQSLVMWSLNDRMSGKAPSQATLLTAEQLKLAVQGWAWLGFEYLWEERLHNFSGQHVLVLGHPCSKAACSYIKIEFLVCVCKESSSGWVSHQRCDRLGLSTVLAACDKLVPKFPVVWWVRDYFLFLFSTWRNGLKIQVLGIEHDEVKDYMQWWGLQSSRKGKQ